jgi:hypothetical protein
MIRKIHARLKQEFHSSLPSIEVGVQAEAEDQGKQLGELKDRNEKLEDKYAALKTKVNDKEIEIVEIIQKLTDTFEEGVKR